jgi:hypothetical protein
MMKSLSLVSLALAGIAVTASCSQESLNPGTTASAATGGAQNSAGQTALGGNGGSTGGTTGGTGTGGAMMMMSGGTGGAMMMTSGGTGGSTGGIGGSNGGTGGTTPAAGGSAGMTMTTGGSAGTGGGGGMTAGGSGGAPVGGSAGTGAGGMPTGAGGMGMAGGGGTLDPATLVPGLDGWYWEISATNGDDPGGNNYYLNESNQQCPSTNSWATTGVSRTKTFEMKGTAGTKYTINFEVRGAMGLRCYTGGTAIQMQPSDTGPNNGWYVGGKQANDSIWNTYELDVSPAVTGEANTYFLNGIPSTSNSCDKELSYEVNFKAKFVVMGDSTLTFTTHDANCKAQQNCGPTPASGCVPRTIALTGLSPAPTAVHQPVADVIGVNTFYPQWLYFDVQSITSP